MRFVPKNNIKVFSIKENKEGEIISVNEDYFTVKFDDGVEKEFNFYSFDNGILKLLNDSDQENFNKIVNELKSDNDSDDKEFEKNRNDQIKKTKENLLKSKEISHRKFSRNIYKYNTSNYLYKYLDDINCISLKNLKSNYHLAKTIKNFHKIDDENYILISDVKNPHKILISDVKKPGKKSTSDEKTQFENLISDVKKLAKKYDYRHYFDEKGNYRICFMYLEDEIKYSTKDDRVILIKSLLDDINLKNSIKIHLFIRFNDNEIYQQESLYKIDKFVDDGDEITKTKEVIKVYKLTLKKE